LISSALTPRLQMGQTTMVKDNKRS